MFSSETMPIRQQGPWYRGGVSRSYVPATVFVSVGYAVCITCFSIFFIIAGGAITGFSKAFKNDDPRFDTEFFRKHREENPTPRIFTIIGPVLLGIGFTMLLIAIILCIFVAVAARKQENNRRQRQQDQSEPLSTYQPPPASAYPHQQQPQDVPFQTTGYPTQPNAQFSSGNQYPSQPPQSQYPSQPPQSQYPSQPPQSQYPSQPPYYYPPTSAYPQPSGTSYPPTAPDSNVPPQNLQYIPPEKQLPTE